MSNLIEFTSIEVENIFAYEGLNKIDLSGCTDEKNIIVVSGRNGAGKTSLLNAVKLLFVGADNDEIRRVGFGGTPLSTKHYVMGQPGHWYGVFNNTSKSDAPARVSLHWQEGARKFIAERLYKRTLSLAGFSEALSVTVDNVVLDAQAAKAVIAALAPQEVIPFFFFDGEQVQSFADAEEGRERAEIERLLGLSFIPELTKEIDEFSKLKRRAGLPENIQLLIVRAENSQRDAIARRDAANRARVEAENELSELRRQRARLEDERDGLRTGISETDRKRMASRISILKLQHEKLAMEVGEELPPEAPWLTNLGLVHTTFSVLEKQLATGADATLSEKLHHNLSDELVQRLKAQTPPILFDSAQNEIFVQEVRESLVKLGVPINSSSSPLLASLSPLQIRFLRDKYLIWSERGAAIVSVQAEKLRQLRQVTNDYHQAQQHLDEAELTTDENRLLFDSLTTKLADIELQISAKAELVTEQRVAEQRAEREAVDALDTIRTNEGKYDSVVKQNHVYKLSLRVKRALEDYRDLRRMHIRESVENRLNQRVAVLLGPSQLIKTVTLDDKFVMKYFDERSSLVARRSISAGMRQLLAMSMLWALRDEARRELPVMIDTPLGRIDRANRSLLMSEYFPNAGKPLILLHTDTEITGEDLAQIKEHVVRKYEIKNLDGVQAKIVEQSLTNIDMRTSQ